MNETSKGQRCSAIRRRHHRPKPTIDQPLDSVAPPQTILHISTPPRLASPHLTSPPFSSTTQLTSSLPLIHTTPHIQIAMLSGLLSRSTPVVSTRVSSQLHLPARHPHRLLHNHQYANNSRPIQAQSGSLCMLTLYLVLSLFARSVSLLQKGSAGVHPAPPRHRPPCTRPRHQRRPL